MTNTPNIIWDELRGWIDTNTNEDVYRPPTQEGE
jgi:hypothetical protein